MCKCFTASVLAPYVRFAKVLIEANVNMSNELIFSEVYLSVNYIGSLAKFYINPFRVHSLCTQPNVIYISINLRKKMKFILKMNFRRMNFRNMKNTVLYGVSEPRLPLMFI